jgi:hypothetical protein
MKLLKLTLIILLLNVLAALYSCGPEPIEPIKKTELGFLPLGEAKDYVYFKKGTWWVYKNTKTGLKDSIVVTFSLLDTLEQNSQRWHFTNELFDVQSKSLSDGYHYDFYMRSLSAEVTDFKWGCIPTMERSNPYEGDLDPFYYPFDLFKDKSGDYEAFCITVRDTMIISNKIYKDVAIFYIKRDPIEPLPMEGNAAKYYWARNYGLIQKDIFNSKFQGDTALLFHSWKLTNSNIIQ